MTNSLEHLQWDLCRGGVGERIKAGQDLQSTALRPGEQRTNLTRPRIPASSRPTEHLEPRWAHTSGFVTAVFLQGCIKDTLHKPHWAHSKTSANDQEVQMAWCWRWGALYTALVLLPNLWDDRKLCAVYGPSISVIQRRMSNMRRKHQNIRCLESHFFLRKETAVNERMVTQHMKDKPMKWMMTLFMLAESVWSRTW